MTTLRPTSLTEEHRALGAKMGPYAGFEMPLQYSSVKEEVHAVRNTVGVFDVSHMGEFFVQGPDTHAFIDSLLCNDYMSAPKHKAAYSPLCREDGTVIDDLIAYKLDDERAMICVNAANIEKDRTWMVDQLTNGFNGKKFDREFQDRSDEYSLLALQGPHLDKILTHLKLTDVIEKPNFSVIETEWIGQPITIAKTGYTGETGIEIFCSHTIAVSLWRDLMALNVTPCGLVSRDVLRLEVCYPLYGNEIHDQVTPLDSALKWTVKLEAGDFVGKEALQNYKPKYRLIKLVMDKGVPRSGYEVLLNGEKVGVVTSGTMSVSLGKGIALAHIDASVSTEHDDFEILMRNRTYDAKRQKSAFVKGGA